jgi:hypothetical protein
VPNGIPAGIDDQRLRRQHGFDVFEQKRSFGAGPNESRRRCIQSERRPLDLGQERRDAGGFRRDRGTCECVARRPRPQPAKCDAGDDELERGSRCRRKHRHVEIGDGALRVVQLSGEKEPASREVPCVGGIHDIALPG